ncbi:hypothetical protein K438DRAFT_1787189 [Mycena galopus ATCC 62051]|nr:hypothetical protein K438DRAFT_1787189 [Mycena galopus ATCC 62051]
MPPPAQGHCLPAYWGEPGHEDPRAVCVQGKNLYVVTNGRICGVFFEQVEGVTNSHWRKVKSWEAALEVWNETCDVYHDVACPPRQDLPMTVDARAFRTGFELGISSSTAALAPSPPALPTRMRTRTVPQAPAATPPVSPTRIRTPGLVQTPSPPASPTRIRTRPFVPPSSPLAMMDAVDTFSRMGVAKPSTEARPVKQWALQEVPKFFPERIDAIDYIFKNHLEQATLKGLRNVRKLRAFMRGKDYMRQSGDARDSDEE